MELGVCADKPKARKGVLLEQVPGLTEALKRGIGLPEKRKSVQILRLVLEFRKAKTDGPEGGTSENVTFGPVSPALLGSKLDLVESGDRSAMLSTN